MTDVAQTPVLVALHEDVADAAPTEVDAEVEAHRPAADNDVPEDAADIIDRVCGA